MNPHPCHGYGECLVQCEDGNYRADHKNPYMSCTHNCEPKKCPNFLVCGRIVPEALLQCKRGRCLHCDFLYHKILKFTDEPAECPICLETAKCVDLINCTHRVCIPCFKRCCDGPPEEPQPPFPYPELEDEFDEDPSGHPLNFDPRVIQWYRDMDAWEHRRQAAYDREKGNRKCPLCRKSMIKQWGGE